MHLTHHGLGKLQMVVHIANNHCIYRVIIMGGQIELLIGRQYQRYDIVRVQIHARSLRLRYLFLQMFTELLANLGADHLARRTNTLTQKRQQQSGAGSKVDHSSAWPEMSVRSEHGVHQCVRARGNISILRNVELLVKVLQKLIMREILVVEEISVDS
jgi:hypothetical protein